MNAEQITKLEKLKELLDKGILSQEEFDAKKKEILDSDDKASTNAQTTGVQSPTDGRPQNIIQCYQSAFRNYFNFKSRASRYEYWGFVITNFLISLVISIFDAVLGTESILSTIYSLVLLFPSLAICVRRFHDINKSGLYLLIPFGIVFITAIISSVAQYSGADLSPIPLIIYLVTFVVAGIIFIYWLCKKGDESANQYGEPRPAETPHEKKVFILAVVLSVLIPILSVFFAGMISGYSSASLKYNTNKTLDQISNLVVNIRTVYSSEPSYNGLNNNTAKNFDIATADMIGEDGNLTNPFGGDIIISNNGELFSIMYLGLPEENCKYISNGFQGVAGLYVTSDSCTDCAEGNCALQIIGQ